MAGQTKIYLTTERAGFVVAGRRVPGEWRGAKDKDGKPLLEGGVPAQEFRPKIGVALELLPVEADYELSQGTIVEQIAPSPVLEAKSLDKASKAARTGAEG